MDTDNFYSFRIDTNADCGLVAISIVTVIKLMTVNADV